MLSSVITVTAVLLSLAPAGVGERVNHRMSISAIAPPRQVSSASLNAQQAAAPKDRLDDEMSELLSVASTQLEADDYVGAIASYREVLSLIESQPTEAQPTIDLEAQAEALDGLGFAYVETAQYNLALPVLEEALRHFESLAQLSDPDFELTKPTTSIYADALIETARLLGFIYRERASFGSSLGYYQIAEASERPHIKLDSLFHIGLIQADIGQYEVSLQTLQEVIGLSQQEGDGCLEASSLNSIGWVYGQQENYPQAITHFQRALEVLAQDDESQLQNCETTNRTVRTLNNIGVAHRKQRNFELAQETFDRGFALLDAEEDLYERGILLDSLGSLYQASDQVEEAWRAYLTASQLSIENDDKVGEIQVLLNLGQLMEAQEQPSLAIFFYKQAIAKLETIRQDLRQLSLSVQEKYQLTIEGFYRNTADLLLQQNRKAEALQVLELLKLQEVKAYLHNEQDHLPAVVNGFNTPAEEALLTAFNQLLATTSLADFIASSAATALSDSSRESSNESSTSTDNTAFNLAAIDALQGALVAQQASTAVLYPLILDDRLEILLITPDGVVEHFSTAVSKTDITNTVGELQKKLKSKPLDAKPPAQALYKWLIGPIDETLAAHQVENIIYLPDGVLRYVPLAALHDGEQWLAEKYQSHNITAATVDNLTEQNPSSLSVVAGAFTDSEVTHEVQIGPQSLPFRGLNGAQQEVQNLQEAVPDSMALFNNEFTAEAMLASVGDHRIVHLATHAKFVSGQPEDSFILFGDGGTVNMRDIQSWTLPTVDLVVLSACETGSSFEGEGKEILGLGYQIQQTGAASAIASLWAVDDTSTAALMTQFYRALSHGESKAQALKTAQIAMMNSDSYNDPHAWAAFILIGNGR